MNLCVQCAPYINVIWVISNVFIIQMTLCQYCQINVFAKQSWTHVCVCRMAINCVRVCWGINSTAGAQASHPVFSVMQPFCGKKTLDM